MGFFARQWDWWIQPFLDYDLLRDALFASILTVVCTSLVGSWITIRGLSFFAESLGHGILPGVAVAALIGGSTLLGAAISAGAFVVGMQTIRRFSPLPSDIVIGLLFVSSVAVAVLLLSRNRDTYLGDINRFLFGNVLGISDWDIAQQAIVAGVILAIIALFYRALMAASYNADTATLLGFRPRLVEIGLLAMLALAVVASFRVVGSLLVFAFLIAPPATASVFARRIPTMMLLSVAFGVLAVFLGLTFSYQWGVAASASMALCSTVIFFLCLIGSSLWNKFAHASTSRKMSQTVGADSSRTARRHFGRTASPNVRVDIPPFARRRSKARRPEAAPTTGEQK